jgi:regulatory protein RepA
MLTLQGLGELGTFYDVNPLSTGDARKSENVSRYLYTVVEHDELSKQECLAIYRRLNLPIKALVDTGGTSLHAIVELDAKDLKEFKERRAILDERLAGLGFDSTSDSVRFTRLPGSRNGEARQRLLAVDIGAKSWDEWYESLEPRLFEIEDFEEMLTNPPELPPVQIRGWLHKGHIGSITGAMKSNKSWTVLELAICTAMGRKWLDRDCAQAHVMYFDAEVEKPFWVKRCSMICEAIGVDLKELARSKQLQPVFVVGADISIAKLADELERMHLRGKLAGVGMIVIDPIYFFYEDDWEENSNEDMAKLGRILVRIKTTTGTSIIFAHHHAKGRQDGKRSIEQASGGGALGRFVDSNLAITHISPDEDELKYTLGWTTRHFKGSPKQVAYREEFTWRITDEDPKTAGKSQFTVDQILAVLPDEGLMSEQWFLRCQSEPELEGLKDTRFEKLRSTAAKAGRIKLSKKDNMWRHANA